MDIRKPNNNGSKRVNPRQKRRNLEDPSPLNTNNNLNRPARSMDISGTSLSQNRQQLDQVNRPKKRRRKPASERQTEGVQKSNKKVDKTLESDFEHIEEQEKSKKTKRGWFRRKKSRDTRPKRTRWGKAWLVTKVIMFAALLIGGYFVYKVFLLPGDIIVRNQGDGALALQDNVDPTQLKGEGDGRINLLLIGVDKSKNLADTNILVSIDPFSKDVAMLSVPRDMWVPIEGYGSNRLNAAHSFGRQYEGEGGGVKLLRSTLEDVLGIPIHYYAKVDFTGFEKAVDTLGGIDVTLEESIYDPTFPNRSQNGGYDPFYLEAGQHHLDGETALKYARSRHSSRGDFDRAERQREVLIAMKDKALSLGTLLNPVKLSGLLESVSGNFETDLQLSEIRKLIDIAQEVDNSRIITAGIDNSPDSFLAGTQINGASVLVPKAGVGNFTDIKSYVRNLFIDGYIKRENATIQVLNGTGKPGLATEVSNELKSYGYKVIKIGDAPTTDYGTSVIYDSVNNTKPYTLSLLERRIGASSTTDVPPEITGAEITIIIGRDYSSE